MRLTKKFEAARRVIGGEEMRKLLPIENEALYQLLEQRGYAYDSKLGDWKPFTAADNAPKTGMVDIRIRASTGEVEAVSNFIRAALVQSGVEFTRVSVPDPDDRDGPAVTARVYMSFSMPKGL